MIAPALQVANLVHVDRLNHDSPYTMVDPMLRAVAGIMLNAMNDAPPPRFALRITGRGLSWPT